eukprot:TRINITY_DN9100_c0_g1_i11.p1 TRINITY_DN9100_c0_g1~~TRINITY_DN9100_c0_g1_i11.p1  ORF type:complete len:235 (+),score=29.71 TRINITY_DN9100_c0_g1_i11:51-755(+)
MKLLLTLCMVIIMPCQATESFKFPWKDIQNVIINMIEGLRLCYNWLDTLLDAVMDHKSLLAQQAQRLAIAEITGNRTEFAEATFESLYGNPEEERVKAERKGNLAEEKTLLEAIWESVQFEYFLAYYRKQERPKSRAKRHMPGALNKRFDDLNKRIVDLDLEIAHTIDFGESEEEGLGNDGEPVPEVERYSPYIADVAYAFPVLDFFFPFDGTFNFMETQFSVYDLWAAGLDNL